jgi:hypothetical protein
MMTRRWIDKALFAPETAGQWFVYWVIIAAILATTVELAILSQYPTAYEANQWFFRASNLFLVAFFTFELLLRLVCRPNPKKYLFTWQGVIDLIVLIPAWFSLLLPVSVVSVLWVRVLRLLRLFKALSLLKHAKYGNQEHLAVLSRLAPMFAGALAVKTGMLFLEGIGYWPSITGLETIITVVGFAIGILLSSRLATVHSRIYGFDQSIQSLVGSVEAARAHTDSEILLEWLKQIHASIVSGGEDQGFSHWNKRLREEVAESIPASIYNGMQREAFYVLHRVRTRTPRVYTTLLIRLSSIYVFVLMATMPGVTGLIATLLAIYAIGGMSIIVNAMDKPYEVSEDSFVNADISGLERYLREESGYSLRSAQS